jgi:hypothetical protein
MYELEHPGHLEEARQQTEEALRRQLERVRKRNEEDKEGFDKAKNDSSREMKDGS